MDGRTSVQWRGEEGSSCVCAYHAYGWGEIKPSSGRYVLLARFSVLQDIPYRAGFPFFCASLQCYCFNIVMSVCFNIKLLVTDEDLCGRNVIPALKLLLRVSSTSLLF